MIKKVFSVKNNTLTILENGHIYLFDNGMVATTEPRRYNTYLLPSILIRKQKTDEELAEEYVKRKWTNEDLIHIHKNFIDFTKEDYLYGRKSFGDKEFHLTIDEFEKVYNAMVDGIALKDIIASLTPPIYPHTIEVMHDGNNYLWETLNAIY